MFSVSTKIDYGLLIMLDLAKRAKSSTGTYISLQDIAEQHDVSSKYLAKIIVPLKQAGLVASKEGKDGGYHITRPADRISLKDIVEAVDGPLQLVRCMHPDVQCPAERGCKTRPVWDGIRQDVYTILEHKTLHELL